MTPQETADAYEAWKERQDQLSFPIEVWDELSSYERKGWLSVARRNDITGEVPAWLDSYLKDGAR